MSRVQDVIVTWLKANGVSSYKIVGADKVEADGRIYACNIYWDIQDVTDKNRRPVLVATSNV